MIEYDSSKINKYWPNFRKSIILKFFLLQILSILLIALCLFFLTDLDFLAAEFWIAISVYAVVFSMVCAIVFGLVLKPQKELINLISQISNDSVITKAPDVNSEAYRKSGFSDVLKFIYSLDQSAYISKTQIPMEHPYLGIFDNSKISTIVLNNKNEILYENNLSPNIDDLIFTNEPNLMEWLSKVRKSKISAERIWQRVPNATADDDNRQIYDIFARYKKNDADDVVILFLNRTNDYLPDEDDLNFIAFAAHELRGPITIIRGYLEVLEMELSQKLSSEQRELFSRLTVSANKLSGYINNILTVSRFDRKRISFDLSEHSVKNVIDSVMEDVSLRASAQNRLLDVKISDNLPTIAADLSSISEVLINVIDNAIKYSNEGGIIKIYADKMGDFVDIHVQDFGIGIPQNVLANLFKKFYRSHRSRETVAGTGIGLYISKAIVEGHGGFISVKSVEGEGSTFTISLPIYDTIKIMDEDDNIIKQPGGGWIKNHGKIRG